MKTAKQYLDGYQAYRRRHAPSPYTIEQDNALKVAYMKWIIQDILKSKKKAKK